MSYSEQDAFNKYVLFFFFFPWLFNVYCKSALITERRKTPSGRKEGRRIRQYTSGRPSVIVN